MTDRDDLLLRVDATGTAHPVGRTASQQLRSRKGEWRMLASPEDIVLLRTVTNPRYLKLAGEIRSPSSLCDVVALASQSSWRGELVVYAEKGQRSFYFDGGMVVGASTTVREERLGETMFRYGVVTREQLEAIVEVAEGSNIRVGEAALELDFVKPGDLYTMMSRQVEEVFYASLHVTEGAFFFFDDFDEKNLVKHQSISAGALLMEGARRMDEMKLFREKVPNDTYIPVPTQSGKTPPTEVAKIFEACDGKRDIRDIGRYTGHLEFDVTRAVFQLANARLVQIVAARPQGAVAIVEVVNPALITVHETCDRVRKGAELRDGLARFATGGGVYDPLFMMAGPLPNGSLKPERVAKNLAALAGDDPDAWLAQLLQDYVGFALFQAESLVPRESHTQLIARVTDIMKPLRQLEAAGVANSKGFL